MNNEFIKHLIAEKRYLQKITEIIEPRIKAAPEGRIKATITKKKYYCYYIIANSKEKYLKKQELPLAKQLAQKEYDKKLKKLIDTRLKTLSKLINTYQGKGVLQIFNDTPIPKRHLITPVELPDEEFIMQWKNSFEINKNTFPIHGNIITEKGEHVRSKSEKIIADKLSREGITYVYEPRLTLKNGKNIYPDFAVLDIKHRRTIYWEHFGMMDDPEYGEGAVDKINTYEKNNIRAGQDIIFTFETKEQPLDYEIITKTIEYFFQ